MKSLKQILADVEQEQFLPLYYLYGEEPYKAEEFVKRLKGKLFKNTDTDLAIDILDGAQCTGYDVLEKLQSQGLFFQASEGPRLVLVRQGQSLKDPEGLMKSLEAQVKDPWPDHILVMIATGLDGRKKFHQYLKKQGFTFECTVPQESELLQWAQYMAKAEGITATADALELLCFFSQNSLFWLKSELEKTRAYAGIETPLTRQHVEAIASQNISHEMVELVQAVLEKKKARALLLIKNVIRAPEDAMGFVGFMTWAMKNPERFSSMQKVTAKRRFQITEGLLALDERLKSSSLETPLVIDQFIVEN